MDVIFNNTAKPIKQTILGHFEITIVNIQLAISGWLIIKSGIFPVSVSNVDDDFVNINILLINFIFYICSGFWVNGVWNKCLINFSNFMHTSLPINLVIFIISALYQPPSTTDICIIGQWNIYWSNRTCKQIFLSE